MAQIEAHLPMVATRTSVEADVPEYSDGTPMGKLISVTMTPNSGAVDLYGDDAIAESVTTPTQETISLNATTLPLAAAEVALGVTVTTDTSQTGLTIKNVKYANEQAPFVGFGFIDVEMVDNERTYVVNFYPRCKFQRPARTSNTKGQTVQFSTPTIAGVAYFDDEYGCLKDEYAFVGTGAAAAAIAKLKELCGET
ncbi:MAG: hypothetical protein IKD54_08440 [Clostridia bacterium]|nr:hypothetical protein [Clostridia bacterium]